MTQFLPPNLLALFAPRDPIPYLPPANKLPHEKKNSGYIGVGVFLKYFEVLNDILSLYNIHSEYTKLCTFLHKYTSINLCISFFFRFEYTENNLFDFFLFIIFFLRNIVHLNIELLNYNSNLESVYLYITLKPFSLETSFIQLCVLREIFLFNRILRIHRHQYV